MNRENKGDQTNKATANVEPQFSRKISQNFQKTLNKIKVIPIASESLGARSICTLVETPDITLLLDAGVSLCPYRFNLPPHPIEFQALSRLRQDIAQAANKASIVTISHYHFDHNTPSFEDWVANWTEQEKTAQQIYQNKTILAKNPEENINISQRNRASVFQKTAAKYAKTFETADAKTFHYGKTKIQFSQAVPHGSENTNLGWIIMTIIEHEDERFMFAPDVQGPMSTATTELILAAKPQTLILGGPPLYLAHVRVDPKNLKLAMQNLERIITSIPVTILEHHVLRDENWKTKLQPIINKAKIENHTLLTAAEYTGKENQLLEATRKKLYKQHPISEEFKQWTKTLTNKNIEKPPIEP